MSESPPRVLVIEDDPANVLLLQVQLTTAGFEVTSVETGEGAVALLSAPEAAFDVVLMDMQLPDIDGIELAGRLREVPGGSGRPLIGLSGRTGSSASQAALAAGIDRYLSKPITRDALSTALREAIAGR